MATSPIYSWPEPDNTDLVKNGALAIRTLGNAIDTTMGTMVAKTIVDAKGDLIAATAADTVARLAVGANNTVLTADSSTATGLKWATPASGGMTLLSTTTLSGASTTISSISGSYNRLFVFVSGVTNATADGTLKIVPNASAGQFYINQINNGSLSGSTNADLVSATMDRTNGLNSFSLTFDRYASSLYFVPFSFYGAGYRAAGSPYSHSAGAWYSSGSSITSLVFSNTGGNLSGGTVLVYGVN